MCAVHHKNQKEKKKKKKKKSHVQLELREGLSDDEEEGQEKKNSCRRLWAMWKAHWMDRRGRVSKISFSTRHGRG